MKKKMMIIFMVSILVLTSIGFSETPTEVLNQTGIIRGNENGFEEDKPLTRQEMVTILARINPDQDFNEFSYDGSPGFVDVPDDHWASKYITYTKAKMSNNNQIFIKRQKKMYSISFCMINNKQKKEDFYLKGGIL